jgi:transcription-repair coupling factor (superfamily II helicase)
MALENILSAFELLPAFVRVAEGLPARGARLVVAGLPGSSDAVLLAALARRFPNRFFVVLAPSVPEGERWLADLGVLGARAAFYPPREGLGEAEPHAEVAGERVETLERLIKGELSILVTTPRALQELTSLPAALDQGRRVLRRGDRVRLSELVGHFEASGFERVPLVDDVAQFAVRGGVLDVYGFGMPDPVRLEFDGDTLADLRYFDLATQLSTRPVESVVVLPSEVAAAGAVQGTARRALAELWPGDPVVVIPGEEALQQEWMLTWEEAAHHIEMARRRGEYVAAREELFLPPEAVVSAVLHAARIVLGGNPSDADVVFPLRPPERIERDIRLLRSVVRDGTATLILCDNEGQVERLEELLGEERLRVPGPALAVGVLHGGFILPARNGAAGLRVLTDHEIFRRERRLRRARRYGGGVVMESLTALQPGDYVVHLEHGIGIYRGLDRIEVQGNPMEVAVIEYEGGDRLNVPLYRLHEVEPYRAATDGDGSSRPPRLHRLGGRRWKQQREKARAAIREMAVELLDLYARRRLAERPPHLPDTAWQRQLESSFLFEDTPDQRKATLEVKGDMERPQPMDRLLVGDVGYGKTEVAIRAAFKAVQSGRQVAVLVPTTILADQHLRTFGERLADFPVRIASLTRFLTSAEQQQVLAEIEKGAVDIVIGTHRLLSPDVRFAALGLVVVDEEHRFGVQHKERLKQLRLETDVLTLTATPIPRTLHLALAGLRDVTLMQTPPRDRSPVLTYVEPWDDDLIVEGISRELDRGGQVFFVHNRVETIQAVADHLSRLVPRAAVGVAHGQMRERDLEAIMRRFVEGEIDVLVSTVIVESGLDVPNANTMFVHRADQLGLAQLYQLRGRVGRSHRRAYCYLLVPDAVDPDAERRLKVLQHHTELGAGYWIALKDLELRGAGNLLGPEQSGFVQAVGFDMYLRLLEDTVRRLRDGVGAPPAAPAEVTLDIPAYIPDEYLASQEVKLDVYRRLTNLRDAAALEGLRRELRDRFGPLPAPVEALLAATALRLWGGELGVASILVHGDEARISFRETAVPRLKGLQAAFHEVQFSAEVRRTHPLSLKLTRQGGSRMLEGLLRALEALRIEPGLRDRVA